MEITYTQQGDYLLPNLTLPEQDKRLSVYGDNNTFAISNDAARFYIPICSQNAN